MNALAALADPTRRRIVELLAERPHDVAELNAHFSISQPAVSRHLRVLREHGLVHSRPAAQRRVYSLDPTPLAELDDWLARYRSFWAQRLDALELELRRARGLARGALTQDHALEQRAVLAVRQIAREPCQPLRERPRVRAVNQRWT